MKNKFPLVVGLGILLMIVWSLLACQSSTVSQESSESALPPSLAATPTSLPNTLTEAPIAPALDSPPPHFPWLEEAYLASSSILQQVPVPEGYERLPAAPSSFAYWLRQLPLHPKGTAVLLYNGMTKPYQAGAYRVLNIDIGKRDLQQCADAVMRLRAEYLYEQKAYEDIHFNYTSGHSIYFSDWSKGKRPKVSGSKVYFTSPQGQQDVSYQQFKRYLTNVYSYAGTASLSKELLPKKLENIEAGDVFIQGGFPGHAVLVMDVAQHPTTGERLFLLAQSYMPAQSIHLLHNPSNSDLSPWYSNDFSGALETPEWTFYKTDLHQF